MPTSEVGEKSVRPPGTSAPTGDSRSGPRKRPRTNFLRKAALNSKHPPIGFAETIKGPTIEGTCKDERSPGLVPASCG